jgi:hypothetical protein
VRVFFEAKWPAKIVTCSLVLALMFSLTLSLHAQVFQNMASSWGIVQYDWDGIYGAAVSTADWNNDGWPDITSGATDGALRTFVNQEGTGFQALPLPWLMESEVKALIWIDLDNDGDDDLFIQEDSGRCGLLRNDGNNEFTDVTEGSQLPQDETEAAGVSFGDMDNDGDLDLHLCRYLEYPLNGGASDRNVLMRNEGGLAFTDVSASSGLDVHLRLSFQSIWWDHNGDGWQDIFVINDKNGANALFHNQGNGTFVDVASNYSADVVMDCMTATLGDFNQDMHQDLFLTNTPFGGDGLGSKLLVNSSSGTFQEAAHDYGLDMDRYCWGALWMDVDNDADLDLFVAEHNFLEPYGINYLYQNTGPFGGNVFMPFGTDVYDIDYLNSHVVASADFDGNGWIDFVMHNVGNHALRLWLNGGFDNGFESVGIALQGTLSNRPAVGSRIDLVTSDGLVQSRWTHAGENYLCQENEVELFGLAGQALESVVVHWPSGLTESFDAEWHGLQPMQAHLLVEGHSLCPQAEVAHSICSDSTELDLSTPSSDALDVVWTDETGSQFDPEWPWSVANGNITMAVHWGDVELCQTTHHVELVALTGDLDLDGHVGASDVLPMLSSLGCTQGCAADLDGDQSVAISDLLVLLTAIGQSCL